MKIFETIYKASNTALESFDMQCEKIFDAVCKKRDTLINICKRGEIEEIPIAVGDLIREYIFSSTKLFIPFYDFIIELAKDIPAVGGLINLLSIRSTIAQIWHNIPELSERIKKEKGKNNIDTELYVELAEKLILARKLSIMLGGLRLNRLHPLGRELYKELVENVKDFTDDKYGSISEIYAMYAIVKAKADLKLNPVDSKQYRILGRGYLLINKPKLAVASLRGAILFEPDSGINHYYLGMAFFMLNRIGDSAKSFEMARKLKYILANAKLCEIYAILIKKEPEKKKYYKNKIKALQAEMPKEMKSMKKLKSLPVIFIKEKIKNVKKIFHKG